MGSQRAVCASLTAVFYHFVLTANTHSKIDEERKQRLVSNILLITFKNYNRLHVKTNMK